jgi:hypothetical protein
MLPAITNKCQMAWLWGICDAFLKAGSETYRKNGSKHLQRFLSRQMKDGSE